MKNYCDINNRVEVNPINPSSTDTLNWKDHFNQNWLHSQGLRVGDMVVVAMSGGVDSSTTAAILKYLGLQVVGITLELYKSTNNKPTASKTCCAGRDIYDAKKVADLLNIDHYVFDYSDIFKRDVIDYFIDSYKQAKTPIPCVKCNQSVKFRDLLAFSRDMGAAALVTGHYAQIINNRGVYELHKGTDEKKDQSYFLFATTQEQLNFTKLPLGNINKNITRLAAKELGVPVFNKPDSQDICFVPDGDYVNTIKTLENNIHADYSGIIRHENGTVLGKHRGYINYTLGQRKGVGISYSEPLYVTAINSNTKEVTLGPKESLAFKTITLEDCNWYANILPSSEVSIKIRSTQQALSGYVTRQDKNIEGKTIGNSNTLPGNSNTLPGNSNTLQKNLSTLELVNYNYSLAKGQACVVYDGTRVLGGGFCV